MFAFDKACISTKEKEAEKKKRPVPGSPVYRPVHMPGPMQAQNVRIVQRYPVAVENDKIVSTAGRPDIPNIQSFFRAIEEQMRSSEYKNPFEIDFISRYPSSEEGIHSLGAGGYRHANGLALCHKVSISDIEEIFVRLANTGSFPSKLRIWLDMLYEGASFEADNIIKAPTIELKAQLVNEMILKINECAGNYFLGDAQANSSIQNHPDYHIGFETGDMSPVSGHIHEYGSEMGISAPKSDGFRGVASSSVSLYWETKRKNKPWTQEEDEALKEAILIFGDYKWGEISDVVSQSGNNRSRSECADRWNRTLNPAIKKGVWTKEEEERLLALVGQYGNKQWRKVSMEMGNRTDVQCRNRYNQIQKRLK